jgi:hypothetical protein
MKPKPMPTRMPDTGVSSTAEQCIREPFSGLDISLKRDSHASQDWGSNKDSGMRNNTGADPFGPPRSDVPFNLDTSFDLNNYIDLDDDIILPCPPHPLDFDSDQEQKQEQEQEHKQKQD